MVGVGGWLFVCLYRWSLSSWLFVWMDMLLYGVHACSLPCHVLVSRDLGVSRKVRFSE